MSRPMAFITFFPSTLTRLLLFLNMFTELITAKVEYFCLMDRMSRPMAFITFFPSTLTRLLLFLNTFTELITSKGKISLLDGPHV